MTDTNVNQPEIYFNLTGAPSSEPSFSAHRVLIVGQMKATSTGLESPYNGVIVPDIPSDGSKNYLWGEYSSPIAEMVNDFRKYNKVTSVDAVAFSPKSTTATHALYTIGLVGTADADTNITIYFGNGDNSVSVDVASGDTAQNIVDAIYALIPASASTNFMVYQNTKTTGGGTTANFTVYSKAFGTIGNNINIKVVGDTASVAFTLTFTTPAVNGWHAPVSDTINPENFFNPAKTTFGATFGRYHTIIYGFQDETDADIFRVGEFLDDRFNTQGAVLDGVAIYCMKDTAANIKARTLDYNYRPLVTLANFLISQPSNYIGGSIFESSYNISAQVGALRALRLTDGADITEYTLGGGLDNEGGPHISSKPYFNTPLKYLPVIEKDITIDKAGIDALKDSGVTLLGNNSANITLLLNEVVTSYKNDPITGNPDTTWHYLCSVDTASAIREAMVNTFKNRFGQARLTDGDLIAGVSMINKSLAETTIDGVYVTLSGSDYVLTRAGATQTAFFKANRIVTLNMATGKITANMNCPIVTQFRKMSGNIQIVI